jgi:5'-3' exonuclease
VEKVCIWTPGKDLAQCVRGQRVVQVDQKGKRIRDAEGVREKFGVEPALIPDFLALVGDAADGYPGIPGIGTATAAQLLNRHGAIEQFPAAVLGDRLPLALLFKRLATLRTDAPLFSDVEELRWLGPTPAFAVWAERMESPRILERCQKALAALPAATE